MGRRWLDEHIDEKELNALVPSRYEAGSELESATSECVSMAERHVASCPECRKKVQQYLFFVNRLPIALAEAMPRDIECPEDIDWNEVAKGHWPEFKAKQLMMHAALCQHCGPLLRAATRMQCSPSHQDEAALAVLNARPDPGPSRWRLPLWHYIRRLAPAAALIVIVGFLSTRPTSSRTSPLSGEQFADLAVRTHQQQVQGKLALDISSESQQTLNEWLESKLPYRVELPVSPAAPGEERPYRPEGARLVQIGSNRGAFIVYRMETSLLRRTHTTPAPASLMVIPSSAATASGGLEARFAKVSFHYATVDGYKVVTWSVHGLTYALVSEEGNNSQRSCMVCHSAMRDRDLSQTPTPLGGQEGKAASLWQ